MQVRLAFGNHIDDNHRDAALEIAGALDGKSVAVARRSLASWLARRPDRTHSPDRWDPGRPEGLAITAWENPWPETAFLPVHAGMAMGMMRGPGRPRRMPGGVLASA